MRRLICGSILGMATFLVSAISVAAEPNGGSVKAAISGELKTWHKVTLTVDGPQASEGGTPNPFLDYRMQVIFRHPATGLTYNVPGYFAADGDAANTSANSGNQWRAHLSPDHEGEWTYAVSFRECKDVAISDAIDEGSPVENVDGLRGSFQISKTDKTGRDFRGKGRLNYVGKHHLQFAETGEFFLKAGVDAPENLLAYKDFDGDFKTDGKKDHLVKDWTPHIQDWQAGDPTWQNDKGKGLIGAVNYLAAQKLNAFSFLTLNIDGDDRNVFPYTNYGERTRIDCSRMDQWEMVFEHGTKLGMYLHFKTLEAENTLLLDKGEVGPQRRLYYRELIARFGHHLALNWNLGEEVGLGNKVSTQQKKDWADYFAEHDPYRHHIVIHNGNNHFDLLGDVSAVTGFSLQTNKPDFRFVHNRTREYIRRSVQAGKPWVVACDEPGDAQHSLVPDDEDPTRDNARQNALWGNLMAGGAGVEWYFGYQHPHSDLTCQDYRVRESMWKFCRIALAFFKENEIPFWNMSCADSLVANQDAYCLTDPGKLYLIYRKHGGPITINLAAAKGVFEVEWFNPRTGDALKTGSIQAVQAGGEVAIGNPPSDDDRDWLAVLRLGDGVKGDGVKGNGDKGDGVKGKWNKVVPVQPPVARTVLSAIHDFELAVSGDFVPAYQHKKMKALAINAVEHKGKFAAAETEYRGRAGDFDIILTALTETDGDSTYRLFVAGNKIGEAQNPPTETDYVPAKHRFTRIALKPGDTIRVEFNSASNGKIPEGDAFAYARGRWQSIEIVPREQPAQ